ncbi:MAG TPA: O-methyltransferase [Candidatus Saccharimonadales bacterium]|jgi:caffeoyl-CoA O-methyltransferase|nr:O-methyltransferase [Candidatus Saccharimonadales bacterium]
MPGITEAAVESYIYGLLPARQAVLRQIEEQAKKRDVPIVGPAVARVLYQYARMVQAQNIFEMGSAIGYSTIWWAEAICEGGQVIYTDGSQKNADEARGYFAQAGVDKRIRVEVGDALELLAKTKREFDIIFNDVDKVDYPRVLPLVASRLRRGGLFITDNVLWSGKVTQQDPEDASTRAIQEFNRQLCAMPEFFTTVLPLRDGLAVSIRL